MAVPILVKAGRRKVLRRVPSQLYSDIQATEDLSNNLWGDVGGGFIPDVERLTTRGPDLFTWTLIRRMPSRLRMQTGRRK